MGSTILVTGATGKTARPLISRLVEGGFTVRAASRRPVPPRAGVEPVHFDWADEATYAAARDGVDAVYVVTGGLPTLADPARVGALLAGGIEAGVRRVVLLSALGVENAPEDDPLRRVETAVTASGIPATIVRPGAFMQNFSEPHWSRLDESIRDSDQFVLPGGDAPVSWVSTEDIAAVAAAALTTDGHAGRGYTVTGPERLTMPEVAAQLSVVTGRRVRHVPCDREHVRAGLLAAGASPAVAEHASALYTYALSSGAFGVVTDDVRAVTGRAPVTFADFAALAAPAWRR